MKNLIILIVTITVLFTNSQGKARTSSIAPPGNYVLKSYYEIKNALSDDDANLAGTKALDLINNVQHLSSNELSPKGQEIWKANSAEIQKIAKSIADHKDLSHQREDFSNLSKLMFNVMKGLKINEDAIYVEYCPMKNLYWLSENSDIKNPFLGKDMVSCGMVKGKLEPVSK